MVTECEVRSALKQASLNKSPGLDGLPLKILAQVLANRLRLVISDLIGPEQNYAVKGRSIQDNLHLIREVLEGIEDDTEATLISLD